MSKAGTSKAVITWKGRTDKLTGAFAGLSRPGADTEKPILTQEGSYFFAYDGMSNINSTKSHNKEPLWVQTFDSAPKGWD